MCLPDGIWAWPVTAPDEITPAALGLVFERAARLDLFTGRELEVAQLIAEGHSNKQIARMLTISVKTVESHRASAMRKAGVRTAAEFVRFAIKHNLIEA